MPGARLIGNFILPFLTKLASGYWNVFDPQNGYLPITSGTLRLLDLDRLARRYFFENAMLINLNIFHARVRDVALPSRYCAGSSPPRRPPLVGPLPPSL